MFRYLSLCLLVAQISYANSNELTTVVEGRDGRSLLADSAGRVLYVFEVDNGKPTSACNGGCAEIWPPYLLTDAEVASLKSPFSPIKRSSQQVQLSYNGRPVYTYAFDRITGDDLGDGVGNVWHSIEAGGKK